MYLNIFYTSVLVKKIETNNLVLLILPGTSFLVPGEH